MEAMYFNAQSSTGKQKSKSDRLAGTICVILGENLIDAEKATEAEWPRDVVQVVIGGGRRTEHSFASTARISNRTRSA